MVEHEREPDAARWQAPVEARVNELDVAVTAFLDAGDKNAALRLVCTLSYLRQATGRVMLARDLAARVLDVVGEAGDARDRAIAHLPLVTLAFRQGDQPVALDITETALGLAREAGDMEQAASYLHDGIDVAQDVGSSYLHPGTLTEAGRLLVLCGRTEAGLQFIIAGERQYEVADLTPDPGDDAFHEQRSAAIASLPDGRVEGLRVAGAATSLDDALALARTQLDN